MLGVYLGEMILRQSDNLSKTLQSNTICAADRQNVAGMVVRTLKKLRSCEAFDLFWQKVTDSSETHGVGEPDLPRPPKTYEVGNAMCEIHNEPKTYFRQQYYETIDLAINCINFSSLGILFENLLLKAAYNDKEFDLVLSTKMIFSQSFCIISCAYLTLNFNVSTNPAEHQQ